MPHQTAMSPGGSAVAMHAHVARGLQALSAVHLRGLTMVRLVLSCGVLLMSLAVADGWPEWGIRDNSGDVRSALKLGDDDRVALKLGDEDSKVFPVV